MEEAREHSAVGEGSRPTLVLLPGLNGTGILFRPLLAALSPEIQTLACDYPSDVFLPPAQLAGIVAERIAGLGEVVILAESWSGLICLELLRRNPANVSGVIFVASFAAPPRPILLTLMRFLPLTALLRLPPPASLLRHYCLGPSAGSQQMVLFREALASVRPAVLAARLRSLRKQGPDPAPVDFPVCYLQATRDRLVPARAADAFRAMSHDLEIQKIDGPHFLSQTKPEECASIVTGFVQHIAATTH